MTEQTIGNYRVIAKLGEGGMGKVYRAVDTMVEREVALKSLKPEIAAVPGVVERFRSEAILLAKLNHPAIAQLYTFFKDGGEYFMAMEFVGGDTLQALIQKNGAIPYTRALAYTAQVLQGIGHAHAMGILHRDLKPANIMLTPAERVKITDFGIARALGSAGLTRDGRVIGTLEYMAPERIRGRQDDPRSDLYSVGVVLYQMLTGRLPFEADSDYDLLTAQVQKQPPRPCEIGVTLPPLVEELLLMSLEKDPERRFSAAAAFENAVASLIPGSAAQASRPAAAVNPAETREARLSPAPAAPTVVVPLPAPPTVLVPAPGPPTVPAQPPAPAQPASGGWTAKWGALLFNRRAAAAMGALAIILLAGIAWLVYVNRTRFQPHPATLAATPTVTPTVTPPVLPVKPPEPAADSGSDASPNTAGTTPVPAPAPGTNPRPDSGTPKPKQPPVLSPTVAPDTHGATATTPDRTEETAATSAGAERPAAKVTKPAPRIARLSDIKSLYVDCQQDEMRNAVRDEIKKQLGSKIELMDSPTGADVAMKVTLTGPNGGSVTRALGLKDRAQVRATVVDAASGASLWEQGAGDRKPIVGLFQGESLKRLASRIVKDLKDAASRR